MMNKDIELIICDIDGTLVNEQRLMSSLTKETLIKINEKGIRFGIASGRPVEELYDLSLSWNLPFKADVIIGMNGSELLDIKNDKRFDYYKLRKEWIKEILDMLRSFKLKPYLYDGNQIICLVDDAQMRRSAQRSKKTLRICTDEKELYAKDNAKIMFRVEPEKMEMIERFVQEHPSDNYQAFKTQAALLEFTHKKVSKGHALQKYCELNALDIKKVVAFGDTTNDNSMIQAAGWGVCLLNGSADTKAISDDITTYDNDHDGLAHYILQHYL